MKPNTVVLNHMTKEKKKPRCFLGGTCNGSKWRDELIPELTGVDFYNPVVLNWDEEAYKNELEERKNCDFVIYNLTPKMTGFYSIAEVVDDSHKRPEKTLFSFQTKDGDNSFTVDQLKSMKALVKMLAENGVKCFTSLTKMATFLNKKDA